MERLFSKLAYKRDEGFLYSLLLSPLYLLSLIYGVATKLRQALYSSGLIKSGELECKVLSVGNLTVGGTGKTPVVDFIARQLKEKGFRPAILSRGYKRKGKGIGIVSDGKEILLGPEEAGDEPYMLARRLRNVPVLVGSDRFVLGRYALEKFPIDVVILDDGFQHIRLKRDLDIVIVDGEKGFGNGYLVPRGPLREPVSGIERAGLVLINKSETEDSGISGTIRENNHKAPVFRSRYHGVRLVSLFRGEEKDLGTLSGATVVALSAIANPSSFYALISYLGGTIVSVVSFPDHFSYTPQDLESVRGIAGSDGAEFIVTTEKDAVKLSLIDFENSIPVYYLEIGLDMDGKETEFMDYIVSRISN